MRIKPVLSAGICNTRISPFRLCDCSDEAIWLFWVVAGYRIIWITPTFALTLFQMLGCAGELISNNSVQTKCSTYCLQCCCSLIAWLRCRSSSTRGRLNWNVWIIRTVAGASPLWICWLMEIVWWNGLILLDGFAVFSLIKEVVDRWMVRWGRCVREIEVRNWSQQGRRNAGRLETVATNE